MEQNQGLGKFRASVARALGHAGQAFGPDWPGLRSACPDFVKDDF